MSCSCVFVEVRHGVELAARKAEAYSVRFVEGELDTDTLYLSLVAHGSIHYYYCYLLRSAIVFPIEPCWSYFYSNPVRLVEQSFDLLCNHGHRISPVDSFW